MRLLLIFVLLLTGCYCRSGDYACYAKTGQWERLSRELHWPKHFIDRTRLTRT